MTEIKKITKISILVYGIVCLVFAIYLIFFLDIFLAVVDMPEWQNPYHPRMFGGAMLVVVLFALLVFFKKDWEREKIKLGYELLYFWLIINIIMESSLLAIYVSELSLGALFENILDIIIMAILLVLGVYAYIKQRE
ncbi:MAG: hypothetical protein ACFFB0_05970 [Promethearchaeota archaeon]